MSQSVPGWDSGLACRIASLLVIRALMGLADGACIPPSIVATLEASEPSRHGRNLGIQQMALPLFGLAGWFSIQCTLYLAIAAMTVRVPVGLGLRETAPAVLNRRAGWMPAALGWAVP